MADSTKTGLLAAGNQTAIPAPPGCTRLSAEFVGNVRPCSTSSGIEFYLYYKGVCSHDSSGVEADPNLKSLCPPIPRHRR